MINVSKGYILLRSQKIRKWHKRMDKPLRTYIQ